MDLRALRERAVARLQQRLDRVTADQWDNPTPCEDWDVRALVHHQVDENLWVPELVAGRTVEEVGDELSGDIVGDDPAEAFRQASTRATEALAQPGAMDATIHASFGDISAQHYLGQLLTDAVVHSWDLAAATGQDTGLDPELVEACWSIAERARDEIEGARQSGIFGPAVDVGEDASTQERLLAVYGRDARRWSA